MRITFPVFPISVVFLTVSACSEGAFFSGSRNEDSFSAASVESVSPNIDLARSLGEAFAPPIRPSLDLTQTRPDLPPPPSDTARTVEDFDTTTAQDRAAAVATSPTSGERRLGSTIASLGSPTEPGIWFKTPLVNSVGVGRIEYNGNSVVVELRPSGGAVGAGSQISLAAMRLIEASLTGLPEVTVYAN